MMLDDLTIAIENMEVWSRIGVPESERAYPQRLLVCVTFKIKKPVQDEITQTVDYALVHQKIQNLATSRPRQLLETFVMEIAEKLKTEFAGREIKVTVKKFSLPSTDWVAVSYEA